MALTMPTAPAELPNTYLTPEAMSCAAKQAPPVPWNDFTAPAAAAGVAGTPAAGAAAGACARATELTELSTDCAAVTVRPALVRPRTKPRREIPFDRYFATSSRMASLPEA